MGCCLLSLFFTLGPRLAAVFMWIFTERVALAFENNLVPLLGIIFLPLTTFAYLIVWDPLDGGVTGGGWIAVAAALILDIAIGGGIIYGNRGRLPASS